MAKQNDAGVYKLKNGNWAYRYVLMVNGVRKEVRKAKDEFGAPFKTKREAIKARQAAIDSAQNSRKPKPTVRKTVQEVYQEYCANGRSDGHTLPNASRTASGKTTFAPGSGAVH